MYGFGGGMSGVGNYLLGLGETWPVRLLFIRFEEGMSGVGNYLLGLGDTLPVR
jgi:hypothetical protein